MKLDANTAMDPQKGKGKLRMDSKDLPLKGLRSAESEIIVSGNVEASETKFTELPFNFRMKRQCHRYKNLKCKRILFR